jgi:hypothetical protein
MPNRNPCCGRVELLNRNPKRPRALCTAKRADLASPTCPFSRTRPHEEYAGAGVGHIRPGDLSLEALSRDLATSMLLPRARSVEKLYSRRFELVSAGFLRAYRKRHFAGANCVQRKQPGPFTKRRRNAARGQERAGTGHGSVGSAAKTAWLRQFLVL